MDNYSFEEVKSLINKNLVTPEVLKNILNSTTRRLELYNDKDDLKILQYLSDSELVPIETKDEINKYLAVYNNYTINNVLQTKEAKEERKPSMIIIFSLIIALFVLIFLILFLGGNNG